MSSPNGVAEEARVNHAAQQLFERLRGFTGRQLTSTTVHDIRVLVKDHRQQCKLRGIPFPELVPLVLTKSGVIELVRRDLEPASIQTIIVNLTVKYPTVSADEIAQAVMWAFPQYQRRLDMQPRLPAHRARHPMES